MHVARITFYPMSMWPGTTLYTDGRTKSVSPGRIKSVSPGRTESVSPGRTEPVIPGRIKSASPVMLVLMAYSTRTDAIEVSEPQLYASSGIQLSTVP
jgi:hypothetical protein